LSLCKKLTELIGGQLYIAEGYSSGIEGCPGTRFVIQLNAVPLVLDDQILEREYEALKLIEAQPRNSSADCEAKVNERNIGTVIAVSSSASSLIHDCSVCESIPVSLSPKCLKKSSGHTSKTISFHTRSFSNSMQETLRTVDLANNQDTSSLASSPSGLAVISLAQQTEGGKHGTGEESTVCELPENLSVLFVDDDLVLRKLFSRTLKKLNPTWKIQEASNGETAIEMLTKKEEDTEKQKIDLIFMDQYMASVNEQLLGTETVRAIRAHGIVEPIICGLSANDVEDSFIDAGSDPFMFKPFPCKPEALKVELHRILSVRR
jgi:CheY-like chemotaxis protein